MLNSGNRKNIGQYIVVTINIKQEGNIWLARCVELGTSTFGDTFEEAREALHEAIELHLNTLEDVNECNKFLSENGVKIHDKYPSLSIAKGKTEILPGEFVSRDIKKIPQPAYC